MPQKTGRNWQNSLRGGNIFWAGENIGKYDRFPLGQNFLPVTFLFLLQPIANSRAGRDRSKSKNKRENNVKVRTKETITMKHQC